MAKMHLLRMLPPTRFVCMRSFNFKFHVTQLVASFDETNLQATHGQTQVQIVRKTVRGVFSPLFFFLFVCLFLMDYDQTQSQDIDFRKNTNADRFVKDIRLGCNVQNRKIKGFNQ